jgi:hypothetical protein
MITTSKLVTFALPRTTKVYRVIYMDNKIDRILHADNSVADPGCMTAVENVVLSRIIYKLPDWVRIHVYRSSTAIGNDSLVIVEDYEGSVYLRTLNSPDGLLLGLNFNQVVSQISSWK